MATFEKYIRFDEWLRKKGVPQSWLTPRELKEYQDRHSLEAKEEAERRHLIQMFEEGKRPRSNSEYDEYCEYLERKSPKAKEKAERRRKHQAAVDDNRTQDSGGLNTS